MEAQPENNGVFLVEDHPVMRKMLSEAIGRQPGCRLIGMAASAEEALTKLPASEVSLVLVDVSLPRMSGVDLVVRLKQEAPGLHCLMVSGHVEASYVARALDAGACGYVLKGRPRDLTDAIMLCLRGGTYLSDPLPEKLRLLKQGT